MVNTSPILNLIDCFHFFHWHCNIVQLWRHMLRRCFSRTDHRKCWGVASCLPFLPHRLFPYRNWDNVVLKRFHSLYQMFLHVSSFKVSSLHAAKWLASVQETVFLSMTWDNLKASYTLLHSFLQRHVLVKNELGFQDLQLQCFDRLLK